MMYWKICLLITMPVLVSCALKKSPTSQAGVIADNPGKMMVVPIFDPARWTGQKGEYADLVPAVSGRKSPPVGRLDGHIDQPLPRKLPEPVILPPAGLALTIDHQLDGGVAGFAPGSVVLGPKAKAALAEMVPSALSAEHVRLRGNAGVGIEKPRGLQIATGRAIAVRGYFAAHGVDPDKIRILTPKSGTPVPSSDNADVQAGRYVEVKMMVRPADQ